MGARSERHRPVGAGAAVVAFERDGSAGHATCLRMKVPGKQTVPRAETLAVLQVLLLIKGKKEIRIITDAMYVIKGFNDQNRKTYQEGRNGDIWREVYDQYDRLEVKPTVHKVKSHMTVPEVMSLMLTNPEATKWLICNEAADAAAGTYADHLGDFDKELKAEEFYKAQLWKAIKRTSAIELHIRENQEERSDTAEGLLAKAEAATDDRTEEIEAGTKRKIECLMQPNGHKLKRIEGTDTGWMRCTECGRTAGGTSDEYWTRVSCNKNQCATDDYWCRKRYTNKDAESRRRNRRLEKMLAIRDKTTNEARNLTECEADRVADSKSEARHRRILKQKMEESRSKANEVREYRRENKEKEQEKSEQEIRKDDDDDDDEVGEQREPAAKRARCTAEETEGRSGSYANEAAASRQSDTKITKSGRSSRTTDAGTARA